MSSTVIDLFDRVADRYDTVELPVPDAETFWQWYQTHGTRKFFDDQEFHDRLIADLESRERIILRRYAWPYRGRA